MGRINREFKVSKNKFTDSYNKKLKNDIYSPFFYSSVLLLLVTFSLASFMIWHYYGYGQWSMDAALQSFVKDIRTPWLDALFRGITATGETLPVVAITLLVVITFIVKRKIMEAALFGFYMLGSWRLNDFLKEFIQRPRPDISLHLAKAEGFSLPSGHSMNFMALVLLSLYFIWIFSSSKKLKIWLTIVMLTYGLLVGLSRVYLNVHYFSDVITGWSLGAMCASIAVIIHRFIYMRQNMPNN